MIGLVAFNCGGRFSEVPMNKREAIERTCLRAIKEE